MLKVGDKIPYVELPDQHGSMVRLTDVLKNATLVLFFYPKDNTPGCTIEACTFRDSYETFKESGAEVVGISSDSVSSHRSFATRHHLPFTLLSDDGDIVRSQFGIQKTLGLLPARVTFIIDNEGIVKHVFSSQLQLKKHVSGALGYIDSD